MTIKNILLKEVIVYDIDISIYYLQLKKNRLLICHNVRFSLSP